MADSLPNTADTLDALLKALISEPGPVTASDMYEKLKVALELTPEQLALEDATEGRPLWQNRIRTAREDMARRGLISRDPHDQWLLTEKGREWVRLRTIPGGASAEDLGL